MDKGFRADEKHLFCTFLATICTAETRMNTGLIGYLY